MQQRGQVRVGTCHWEGSKRIDPTFPGFTNIICLTKSTEYGMIGPYCLTIKVKFQDEEYNVIFENYFQSSKVYEVVPEACEVRSRFDRTVIWKWPREQHARKIVNPDGGFYYQILPQYLTWRKALMLCPEPVRYPVGKHNTGQCLFSLKQNEDGTINPKMLNYVENRREIYLKEYVKLVKIHPEFLKLKERLNGGENLLIIEVDGPQERSLNYYKEKHGVNDDFIQNWTILVTERNLEIMINDTKERFGHGYCIAGSLLDIY